MQQKYVIVIWLCQIQNNIQLFYNKSNPNDPHGLRKMQTFKSNSKLNEQATI